MRMIMPYWRQPSLPYYKPGQDRSEMRISPATLTALCEAAYRLPYLSNETATFFRSLRLWLRRTRGEQWDTVQITGWREQFCECWALLHHAPFTKTLPFNMVQELRDDFGAAIGGYLQKRYLPLGWDREEDRFAPAQAVMEL